MKDKTSGQTHKYPWEVISAFLQTRVYGELVAHEVLSALSGVSYPGSVYYSMMQRAFDDQRSKTGRCFQVVKARGYRVLLPSEHRGFAATVADRGRERLETGSEILSKTDFALLTEAQRREHVRGAAALSALAEVARETAGGLRLVRGPNRASVALKQEADNALAEIKRQIEDFERAHKTPESDAIRKGLYARRDQAKKAVKAGISA